MVDPHILGWEDYFMIDSENPFAEGCANWRRYEDGFNCAMALDLGD